MSNPLDLQPSPAARRTPLNGVQCLRCHLVQPPVPQGHFTCVSCGAVLPLQRWVAHPPPDSPGPVRKKRSAPPTTAPSGAGGPPSYRFGHPGWGFPPVVWRPAPSGPDPAGPQPSPALLRAGWLAWVTAAAALVAAGAELWRFLQMIDGRTKVLSATAVSTSDALVAAGGVAVLAVAVLTAAIAVPALIRTHRWAAVTSGRAPSRSGAAVAARLLVPGWNVYGAGQIAVEIDTMLSPRDEARPRSAASRLVVVWWISWIVNAVLLLVTLGRGFGGSVQAIADTVELHVAVDLSAAVVAGLGALMLRRIARLASGPQPHPSRWVVQPPVPTRPVVSATAVVSTTTRSSTTGSSTTDHGPATD